MLSVFLRTKHADVFFSVNQQFIIFLIKMKNLLNLNCQEVPQNTGTYVTRLQKSMFLYAGVYCSFLLLERTEIILINFFVNTCQKLERH